MARNNHGAILLRLGRPIEAERELEATLRLDPKKASALVNLAQLRAARGRAEDIRSAQQLFQRAYALAPDVANARALVILALRLGDRATASRTYRTYANRAKAVNQSATPVDVASRAELGASLLAAGMSAEAEEELQAAIQSRPDDADAIVLLARAYLGENKIPAAGRTLEAAVARGVESPAVYSALVDVYEANGNLENAIPAMRHAIDLNPKNENYRFQYGMLLIHSSAPEAAVIRVQEALKEFPDSPRLW